jgi:C4-dicarboxylate-specific signal transduction histidine kinase
MSTKQKILAVDDEPRNLKILRLTLGDEWEVETAVSGEDALEKLKNFTPDVVLLDIMMPGIDGYEVCKRIRTTPNMEFTKVLLVTGKAMIEEKLKGYEVGANDYVTKPFSPEELLAKIRSFMRTTAQEKAMRDQNSTLEDQVAHKAQLLMDVNTRMTNAAKMSSLGRVTSGITQELDTPLAVISTMTTQIKDLVKEGTDAKTVEALTQSIDETTYKIAKIVDSVRAFAREGGNDPMVVYPFEKIVDDALVFCQQRFRQGDVELHIPKISADLFIECRPHEITQVILNLLNNGFDAVENLKERWVRLEFKDEGDNIVVSVTDSGQGIEPSVREKLFEDFFTTKDPSRGAGLGLGVSKKIMDKHHGVLRYDESSANTRFEFRMPKSQGSAKSKSVA